MTTLYQAVSQFQFLRSNFEHLVIQLQVVWLGLVFSFDLRFQKLSFQSLIGKRALDTCAGNIEADHWDTTYMYIYLSLGYTYKSKHVNIYLIHLRLLVTVWSPALLIIFTGFVFDSLSCVSDLGFHIHVIVCLCRAVTGWTLLWKQSLVLIMRSCLLLDLNQPLTVFSGCWCEKEWYWNVDWFSWGAI